MVSHLHFSPGSSAWCHLFEWLEVKCPMLGCPARRLCLCSSFVQRTANVHPRISLLTHPPTCPSAVTLYLGACVEPPCLLMEFCAKKSLDTLLSAGLMDPKARLACLPLPLAVAACACCCWVSVSSLLAGRCHLSIVGFCTSLPLLRRLPVTLHAAAMLRLPWRPQMAEQLSWQRLLGMALDGAKGMLYLHSSPLPSPTGT